MPEALGPAPKHWASFDGDRALPDGRGDQELGLRPVLDEECSTDNSAWKVADVITGLVPRSK